MESGSKCPSYLSKEYLKSALEEGFDRSDIKILNFDIKLANLGGENYCSVIYRLKVDYVLEDSEDTSPKEVHLILKDMRSEVEAEVAKSKEADMYRKVIPEMEKILGGKEILAPKLFKVARYDADAYLFQDLNALEYDLKDRLIGLDENDCIVVLKKIAKFHAASMVFAEKFPDVIKDIQDHYLTLDSTFMDTYVCGMFGSSAEALRQWEGYESIAAKLDKLTTVSKEKSLEACDRTKCRYVVINHCDLWVNNFLIKDDDLAFIDFQLCCYGSPAIDIQYFLYSSVPLDLLKRRRYEFLRIYFKQFEDTLRDIGYEKIPSWEDFVYEMRRLEFYGLHSLMTIFTMAVLSKDESKGTEFDTVKDEKTWAEKKSNIFKVKRLEDTFKYAFDRFNDIGALELYE